MAFDEDNLRKNLRDVVDSKEMSSKVIEIMKRTLDERENRLELTQNLLETLSATVKKTYGGQSGVEILDALTTILKMFRANVGDSKVLLLLLEASISKNITTDQKLSTLLQYFDKKDVEVKQYLALQLKHLQQKATLTEQDRKSLNWLNNYFEHIKGEDDGQ